MNIPWLRPKTLGRELDPRAAIMTGEGAAQRITHPEQRKGTWPVAVWNELPSVRGGRQPDYYRLPLLKEPVWIWSVPLYFYLGGVAGGSAVLVAALHGDKGTRRLASICRWLAFIGTTIGPGLLSWDLGRKFRFLNMLRVFRPTSPMSIGSWALAGSGGLAALSLLQGDSRRGKPAAMTLAAGGTVIAGYTGVLLSNSANPLWQGSRRMLPVLFTASSIASTAGLLEMLPLNWREEHVVHRFGVMGKTAEAAAMIGIELDGGSNPEATKSLHRGKAGILWNGAKALLAAGIVINLLPSRSSWKLRLGGALTTIGAVCLRFAILEAGKEAAREPQAVMESQRLFVEQPPKLNVLEEHDPSRQTDW